MYLLKTPFYGKRVKIQFSRIFVKIFANHNLFPFQVAVKTELKNSARSHFFQISVFEYTNNIVLTYSHLNPKIADLN